ncbi:ubiquitinyl hydrolase 1 [Cytospora paraplurivora]|uniref:Ubiquitin carboxyl-terminal hydrolase n=1 Tax=Cytospora paraplurivora TaxID=2898453 RepID=A0AAN9U6J3_9PEZI
MEHSLMQHLTFPALGVVRPTEAQIRDAWHQSLLDTCSSENKLRYFLVTENRGKRTAWTVYLKVGGSTYKADYWYDYNHLYNGFESAAENAYVLSLDDVDLLPHPAFALILIFPTTDTYERQRVIDDALQNEYEERDDEEILWFKQTINNACGLYSILHALSNSAARDLLA